MDQRERNYFMSYVTAYQIDNWTTLAIILYKHKNRVPRISSAPWLRGGFFLW
jgi:hypothetical protein